MFRFSPALIPAEQQTGSYYNLYTDSKHVVEVGNVKPVFVSWSRGNIEPTREKNVSPGAQLDIQQGGGGGAKGNYFCNFCLPPPLNISRGWQEKCVFYSTMKKILYLGAFIQSGANLCGKNLKLYFRGKF